MEENLKKIQIKPSIFDMAVMLLEIGPIFFLSPIKLGLNKMAHPLDCDIGTYNLHKITFCNKN